MRTNIGRAERVFHLIVGVLILGLYGSLPEPRRYLTLVGLIPFGSALTGFSPFHALDRNRP